MKKSFNFNFYNPIIIFLVIFLVSCDKEEPTTNSKIFVLENSISDTTDVEQYLGYQYVKFGGKDLTSDLIVKTSENIGISLNGVAFGHELSFPDYSANNDTLVLFAKLLFPENENTTNSIMTFESSGAETVIIELN